MLTKLQFQPGVYADGSDYSASGQWVDCDMVRFRLPYPEKIGGWQRATIQAFLGTARLLYPWTDLSGYQLTAVATNIKVYVESGGDLNDITPILRTATNVANALATTIGSPLITVTDVAHGALTGDYVTIAQAVDVGGISALNDINIEHVIETVLTVNTYTIRAAHNATSTVAAGGGANTDFSYQIHTGLDTVVGSVGYGSGGYGGVTAVTTLTGYGLDPPLTAFGSLLRLWSADSFGQDLIFNQRDGAIYYWTRSGGFGTRGVLLSTLASASSVPAVARQIIVTDSDRKVIAFGCTAIDTGVQDLLAIRWSDTEFPQVWDPLETNAAGGFRIPQGAEFIGACETKSEILVWSDSTLHTMRFIGAPLQYGITAIGTTTIMGQFAMVPAVDAVYWMGSANFYTYDGRISVLPCPVQDYVFNDLNHAQSGKICGGSNLSFGEVWWFYPSAASDELDRYVVYNFIMRTWVFGNLSRTAWLDRGVVDFPRAASSDGYIYYHELGQDDGSTNPPSAIAAFIESAPVEIDAGENYGFISRMIPDITFRNSTSTAPEVNMILIGHDQPGSGEATNQTDDNETTQTASLPVQLFTSMTYPRLRARSLTLRIESSGVGVAWRLGVPRIFVRQDGRR